MSPRPENLLERFLNPIAQNILGQTVSPHSPLLDQAALQKLQESIDWDMQIPRLTNPQVQYPDYYLDRNSTSSHPQKSYLCQEAAIAYDALMQFALPPNEHWVRQGLLDAVPHQPRRILDLGCGTGSETLLLQKAFPHAEVVGLDLSPYMLAIANYKAQQVNAPIHWRHGNAETSGFPDQAFDLITASLLLHEMPPAIAQKILQEAHRLLKPGGAIVVLDGNPFVMRQTLWLVNLLGEPYVEDYAASRVQDWLETQGFGAVTSEELWLCYQVTRGVKGIPTPAPEWEDAIDPGVSWAMG